MSSTQQTQEQLDRQAALSTLTPEERAAVEDDELSPDERAALEDIAGDDDDDDEPESKGAEEKKPAAEKPKDEAPADKAPADEVKAEAEDDTPPSKPGVSYKAELPEDFDEKVKALEDEEAALAAKFKAGEVETEAFLAESKRISKAQNSLDAMRIKAEIGAELTAQTAQQEWAWSIKTFMQQVKRAEGIDYKNDEEKSTDFDNFVKALAANPKNADKEYEWFLSEAHKRTKVLHGIESKKADPEPEKKPAAGKPESRKSPVKSVPQTLAQVPGGDGPGDVSDEFVDLDKMDGLEYETALAKMSPAQRERYLRAA